LQHVYHYQLGYAGLAVTFSQFLPARRRKRGNSSGNVAGWLAG